VTSEGASDLARIKYMASAGETICITWQSYVWTEHSRARGGKLHRSRDSSESDPV